MKKWEICLWCAIAGYSLAVLTIFFNRNWGNIRKMHKKKWKKYTRFYWNEKEEGQIFPKFKRLRKDDLPPPGSERRWYTKQEGGRPKFKDPDGEIIAKMIEKGVFDKNTFDEIFAANDEKYIRSLVTIPDKNPYTEDELRDVRNNTWRRVKDGLKKLNYMD